MGWADSHQSRFREYGTAKVTGRTKQRRRRVVLKTLKITFSECTVGERIYIFVPRARACVCKRREVQYNSLGYPLSLHLIGADVPFWVRI